MKNFLLCFLLMLSSMVCSQTIDNPSFKARDNSIYNIARIERTSDSTRVHIHAIFRPKWWIMVENDYYLEDATTGKQYKFKSAEGIELNKRFYMPESGETDFILNFEPLPKEAKLIHFIAPNRTESNTYDISLVPQSKVASAQSRIRGNWYLADGSNQWEYGIYDSITIMQNRIYTNEKILKKGNRIELTVKDKLTGSLNTLSLTSRKDGKCKIQLKDGLESLYTKEENHTPYITADEGSREFFRTDSVCIQGYIDGYDPRLGFETGIMYLSNSLTRKDYPTVVPIEADGSFRCKFLIDYPISSAIIINNTDFPFYIEPGKTLTMYIDWEEILARSRARNRFYPIKNTAYMGPTASISYLSNTLSEILGFDYTERAKAQKTHTPQQYKESMKPLIAEREQICDSLIRIYAPSRKAIHLIENDFSIKVGMAFLDFLMGRDYYAQQDTGNVALKVKEDDAYYDFLKKMPLDDETTLANSQIFSFINRLEYMNPLRQGFTTNITDTIDYTYPAKSLLSYLKDKGVKFNAAQDSIRLKYERLTGTRVKRPIRELVEESKVLSNLYQKEEALIKEYVEEQNKSYASSSTKKHPDEIERERITRQASIWLKQDSIITRLSGMANPLLWQICKVRSLKFELKSIKANLVAREYSNLLKQQLTYPVLTVAAEELLKETHPEEGKMSYQLPQGKPTDIFRNIIKEHRGKVLFVDFWATTCGPCRSGIEFTAELRKKYKNHPEFQFVYISGKGESPEKAYNEYVEKHLKGEACYYVSDTEFKYLRQLFQFNGIPHYVLVEKDGSISKESIQTHNLSQYLEKRFSLPNGAEEPSL